MIYNDYIIYNITINIVGTMIVNYIYIYYNNHIMYISNE